MSIKAQATRHGPAREGWHQRYMRTLCATDVLVVSGAVFLAHYLRFGISTIEEGVSESRQTIYSISLALLWLSALTIFKTRSCRVLGSGVDEYRRVISATFWVFGFIAIASLLLKIGPSRIYLAVALPVGTATLLATRWLWRKHILNRRKLGECKLTMIVLGEPDAVSGLIGSLISNKDNAYSVLGVGLTDHTRAEDSIEVKGQRIAILGSDDEVLTKLDQYGVNCLALAGPERMGNLRLRYLLWDLERRNVSLLVSPTASPLVIEPVSGYPLMRVKSPQHAMARRLPRRAVDIVVATAALLLTSPVLLLAAVAIKITTRGPVIYREERLGLGGTTFQIMKLRTMVDCSTEAFNRANCEQRVTTVGRTLRRLNVDQLPVLVNVLKGDMSVVGLPPRSDLDQELPECSRRKLSQPGILRLRANRILDLLLVLSSLPIWLPVLTFAAVLKLLTDGRPLFYLSKRIGRGGIPFEVYKFRTMVDDPKFIQQEISKLGRIGFEAIPLESPVYTKMGRVFERLQFVELPQILNVLRGDMSLVGYRPLPAGCVLELEQSLGGERVAQRHNGIPGITGFAQLSGKASLTNDERVEIEIAESVFFASASLIASVKVYFAVLYATAIYVLFGTNERVRLLRAKYLRTPAANLTRNSGSVIVGNASATQAEDPERQLA